MKTESIKYINTLTNSLNGIGKSVRKGVTDKISPKLKSDNFVKVTKEYNINKDTFIGAGVVFVVGYAALKCIKEIYEKIRDIKKQ